MAFGNLTRPYDGLPTDERSPIDIEVDTTAASVAATRIYGGSGITLLATGYHQLMSQDETAGDKGLAGIARGDVSWAIAESGVFLPLWTKGDFWFKHSGAARADLGLEFEPDETADPVTVADVGTSNAIVVGRCVGYKTGFVLLLIDDYTIVGGSHQIQA